MAYDMLAEPTKQKLETIIRMNEQVLSTLVWAEEKVPGTNLQSDIIALRDVCLPRLKALLYDTLKADGTIRTLTPEDKRQATEWASKVHGHTDLNGDGFACTEDHISQEAQLRAVNEALQLELLKATTEERRIPDPDGCFGPDDWAHNRCTEACPPHGLVYPHGVIPRT